MNLEDLKLPFHSEEIEWRIARSGQNASGIWATAFAYVTNRAIQQRLDEVCGPANWRNEFSAPPNAAGGSAALCTIYVKIDGEWVGKSDGADNTDFEATKGGLSDSMKRAAVQWGIGRYLYGLDEGWLEEITTEKKRGWRYQPKSDKKDIPAFYWLPPHLPDWALPSPDKAKVIAEKHGMTTGDKFQPPKEKTAYDLAIESIAKATKDRDLALLKKIEQRVMERHKEGVIVEGDYIDLANKLADAEDAIKESKARKEPATA